MLWVEIAWGASSLVGLVVPRLNSDRGQGRLLFTSCNQSDIENVWAIYSINSCFLGCSKCTRKLWIQADYSQLIGLPTERRRANMNQRIATKADGAVSKEDKTTCLISGNVTYFISTFMFVYLCCISFMTCIISKSGYIEFSFSFANQLLSCSGLCYIVLPGSGFVCLYYRASLLSFLCRWVVLFDCGKTVKQAFCIVLWSAPL